MANDAFEGDKTVQVNALGKGAHFDRDIVFYYSRERRLSNASPMVQAMNDGKTLRPSFSKTLFATKGHKLLFGTIVVFFAVSGLVSRFTGRDWGAQGLILGGNTLALTIIQEEDILLLGLVKSAPKKGEFYTGSVDLAVSPVMPRLAEGEIRGEPQVFSHRIFFNPLEFEVYQIVLPFEGSDFFVVLKAEDEQKSMRLKVGETR